jgi:hypothetical protein
MEDMKINLVGNVILRRTFSEVDRHCPLFESLSIRILKGHWIHCFADVSASQSLQIAFAFLLVGFNCLSLPDENGQII